ncbi:hypothetical protein [Pedobacter punctiformis]|uniref:Lipoprotein n=1 Tax=Pedobacter punctiformis TaxID=3004097 RepID=A0ABT4LAU6_9SPHI|nr:hypothetical protein [Pedobacter sp. HCMS5-2]MCZ4245029.1 hypothetical protein [Pedobacter sp. HCMS5-2]
MKLFKTGILTVITLFIISCTPTKKDATNEAEDEVNNQAIKTTVEPDAAGAVLMNIDFNQKFKNPETGTEELVSIVPIDNPGKAINNIVDIDKVILPYKKVNLLIDYPLDKPALIEITAEGIGFTKRELIAEISKAYHKIYEEEENTATVKTTPMDKREGLINRNKTNGKFGICCHDIADLAFTGLEVRKNSNDVTITIFVES